MPAFALNPMLPYPGPEEPFPTGIQIQDEGTDVGPPNPAYVDFVGDGVTASYDAETETVTVNVGSAQSGGVDDNTLQIQADDADVGAADTATLNFEGDVTVVDDGTGKRTVTIDAGGGGGEPLTVSQDDVVVESNVNLLNIMGDAPLVTARSGVGAVDLTLRSGARSILLTGAQQFASVGSNTAWADILMAPPGSGYTVDVTDWGNLPDAFWPTWNETYNYWTYNPVYAWLVTFGIRGTWLGGSGSLENTQFRAFVTGTPEIQNPTLYPVAEHQRLYEGDAFQIGFAGILLPFGSNYLKLQLLNPASGNTIQIDDVRTTFAPLSFAAATQGDWP